MLQVAALNSSAAHAADLSSMSYSPHANGRPMGMMRPSPPASGHPTRGRPPMSSGCHGAPPSPSQMATVANTSKISSGNWGAAYPVYNSPPSLQTRQQPSSSSPSHPQQSAAMMAAGSQGRPFLMSANGSAIPPPPCRSGGAGMMNSSGMANPRGMNMPLNTTMNTSYETTMNCSTIPNNTSRVDTSVMSGGAGYGNGGMLPGIPPQQQQQQQKQMRPYPPQGSYNPNSGANNRSVAGQSSGMENGNAVRKVRSVARGPQPTNSDPIRLRNGRRIKDAQKEQEMRDAANARAAAGGGELKSGPMKDHGGTLKKKNTQVRLAGDKKRDGRRPLRTTQGQDNKWMTGLTDATWVDSPRTSRHNSPYKRRPGGKRRNIGDAASSESAQSGGFVAKLKALFH